MKKIMQLRRWIFAIKNYELGSSFALALFLSPIALAVRPLQAQTLTTLYQFSGGDGAAPQGDLYRDKTGNLYGTTPNGGDGSGTIFEISATGVFSVLLRFSGTDGSTPNAGVLLASGGLYGTTYSGGAAGDGEVFKWKAGRLTVLYNFSGPDGAHPTAALIRDSAGNLYGTTFSGGTAPCSCGTIFKLDSSGNETVLYSFTGGADGRSPAGRLLRDAAGNLYGTASSGGIANCSGGCGTVFKLSPTGVFTVLYSFTGGADGGQPLAGLVRNGAGNLYGTASSGGTTTGNPCTDNGGCGVVFKVSKTGAETVLYTFTGDPDGSTPMADLLRDKAGNLYGTTQFGGIGFGTVFGISASGAYSTLWTFQKGTDGALPLAGLVRDTTGNLYGTASNGGNQFEQGVVFELTP